MLRAPTQMTSTFNISLLSGMPNPPDKHVHHLIVGQEEEARKIGPLLFKELHDPLCSQAGQQRGEMLTASARFVYACACCCMHGQMHGHVCCMCVLVCVRVKGEVQKGWTRRASTGLCVLSSLIYMLRMQR